MNKSVNLTDTQINELVQLLTPYFKKKTRQSLVSFIKKKGEEYETFNNLKRNLKRNIQLRLPGNVEQVRNILKDYYNDANIIIMWYIESKDDLTENSSFTAQNVIKHYNSTINRRSLIKKIQKNLKNMGMLINVGTIQNHLNEPGLNERLRDNVKRKEWVRNTANQLTTTQKTMTMSDIQNLVRLMQRKLNISNANARNFIESFPRNQRTEATVRRKIKEIILRDSVNNSVPRYKHKNDFLGQFEYFLERETNNKIERLTTNSNERNRWVSIVMDKILTNQAERYTRLTSENIKHVLASPEQDVNRLLQTLGLKTRRNNND
jgi:uncharacterized protein YihD (DUF1040 family)